MCTVHYVVQAWSLVDVLRRHFISVHLHLGVVTWRSAGLGLSRHTTERLPGNLIANYWPNYTAQM